MSESLNPNDDPELFDVAVLGKRVEAFWDSDVGQYLLNKALGEYNSALEEFLACSPLDTPTVTRLQSAMIRAASVKEWLSTAISEGIRAVDIIEKGPDA